MDHLNLDGELKHHILRKRFDKGENRFPAIAEQSRAVQGQRSHAQRLLSSSNYKVKVHKIIATVLGIAIIIGIQLPSLIIAGSNNTDESDVFRSLAVVASFFLTGFAIVKMWGKLGDHSRSPYGHVHDVVKGRSQSTVGRLESAFYVTFVSMVLETSLMSIGASHDHLIGFGVAAIVLRFIMLVAIGHSIYRLNRLGCSSEYIAYTHAIDDAEGKGTIAQDELVESWHTAYRLRYLLGGSFSRGHKFVVGLLVLLFLTCATHFTYEFFKIFSQQEPIIPKHIADRENKPNKTKHYMSERLHHEWKVHLVVVDGLRYDMVAPNASAIGDYFETEEFKNYSLMYKARAQLPSFSVPNWMAILSGALPETTGVTGNIGHDESWFDTFFSQAKSYGVHAGMTGTPWWRDLVFSKLPTLDGDGTVDAGFTSDTTPEYPHDTSDPADWERLSAALKAIRRSRTSTLPLYDLFLTHFSDVDKQGHEYGVSTTWNKDNTYMYAIENKTRAIQDIVSEMDNNTVLIVTSDHGHVMRGGHGGVSEVLRDVPVVFYSKSGALRRDAAQTSQDYFHNSTFKGSDTISNLDICGTITALLGIPSPRQSIGTIIEEPIRQLVPQQHTNMIYYDLFMSKLAAVRAYSDTFGDSGMLSGAGDIAELSDPTIKQLAANTYANNTVKEYAEATHTLIDAFWTMRVDRKNFVNRRNIATSIISGIPAVFMILYVFTMHTAVNITASIRGRNPACRLNGTACIAAFLTLVGFYTVSIVAFVVWYAADGYNVWDSTLTHTTSVASKFLVRVIVFPIIMFVVLTKGFLAHTISWKTPAIISNIKARRSNLTGSDVMRVFTAALRDLFAFVFATSNYKPHLFPRAVMYLLYLALWTTISTVILLICQSPYSYLFPIVFSTQHVTENNLEYRFRVITVLMMVTPLQIGTALLLWVLPSRREQDNQISWDHLYVTAYLQNDLQVVSEAEEAVSTQALRKSRVNSVSTISLEHRLELVIDALAHIMEPMLRVTPDLLHLADISGEEAIGENAPPIVQKEPIDDNDEPPVTIAKKEPERRMESNVAEPATIHVQEEHHAHQEEEPRQQRQEEPVAAPSALKKESNYGDDDDVGHAQAQRRVRNNNSRRKLNVKVLENDDE